MAATHGRSSDKSCCEGFGKDKAGVLVSNIFLAVSWLILSLVVVTPVSAQNNVQMRFDGKTYKVHVNGVFQILCRGRGVGVVSPRDPIGGASDKPVRSLKTDGETFPLALVKTGKLAGAVTLTADGEAFPFDVDLKDVRVTDANILSNGTWIMMLRWSACANRVKP